MSGSDQLWFRHPERCWSLGDIKQMLGKDVELREVSAPGNGKTVAHPGGAVFRVPLAETHPCDMSHLGDSDDIALMNNMHEGPLLALLERRYTVDRIYTFTGDILISINPYKALPALYAIPGPDQPLPEYKESKVPHVFAVADAAYRSMLEETHPARKNQSMIVSGESGAGKTEACKHIMRFLASLSQRYCERTQKRDSAKLGDADTTSIEKKVLDCNPFLEAFGNAKTVRNDNSSRFGKFTKIEYDGGRIIGARIRHYLLEKARVVAPQQGERNYHIFYQVVRGATAEERRTLKLSAPEDYDYLFNNGVAVTTVDGVDDVAEFDDVRTALHTVGLNAQVQASMWRLIAGLLHLGNVKFYEVPGSAGAPEAVLKDAGIAQLAGDMLGAAQLPVKLVRRLMKIKGRSSAYEVALTEKQAMVARDALAKTVYERLFTWLIDKCNRILSSRQHSSGFIGILDIFGFEIFEVNSFEQLCINYANEKLQNLFNHHIFVMEQAAYAADGVDVAAIEFINNQPCVDLIEKKPSGLLPLLDEICFLGRETTDKEYLDKIDRAHKGVSKFYGNPKKRQNDRFSVLHFAGEVHYSVEGFIDKNNDTLYTDLEELMTSSSFELLRNIFDDAAMGDAHAEVSTPTAAASTGGDDSGHASPTAKITAKAQTKAKTQSVSTIASKFKTQLGALNDTLMATSPHYVRCVKPNKLKRPQTFDHSMILTQLLYSGVLETVRIRRQGFPFRETYLEFWRRACRVGFTCLVPAADALPRPPAAKYEAGPDGKLVDKSATQGAADDAKRACVVLLSALIAKGLWTTGRTKVFLKDGTYDSIIRRFREHHSVRIQAWWRMARTRAKFRRFKRAVSKVKKLYSGILMRRRFARVAGQFARLQAHFRRRRCQKRYKRMKAVRANAGFKINATLRMWRARKVYVRIREAWEKMQGRMKVLRARKELERRRRAVVRVQAWCRTFVAVLRFKRAKRLKLHGSALIQAAWRMYVARKAYKRALVAVRRIQRFVRAWRAHLFRKRMFALIVAVQAMYKRWRARSQFKRKQRAAIIIQSWWRAQASRAHFKKMKKAVRRIERATFAHVCGRALTHWARALHAACAWGDAAEIDTVLLCRLPEHARVRHIPAKERLAIRNRQDGFKTALHSAVMSGSVPAVQLLVARGANPWLHDSMHATPLHKAAAVGDTAAPVVQYLLSLAGGPPHSANAANAINLVGETVLDTAVLAARASGRRGHDEVVKTLVAAGGVTRVCGATVAQIQASLARPKPAVDPVVAAAEAAAAREREAAERRARERRADPHYQLLFVAEQEREKARKREEQRAALEAQKSAQEAAARQVEAAAMWSEIQSSGSMESLQRAKAVAAAALAAAQAVSVSLGHPREKASSATAGAGAIAAARSPVSSTSSSTGGSRSSPAAPVTTMPATVAYVSAGVTAAVVGAVKGEHGSPTQGSGLKRAGATSPGGPVGSPGAGSGATSRLPLSAQLAGVAAGITSGGLALGQGLSTAEPTATAPSPAMATGRSTSVARRSILDQYAETISSSAKKAQPSGGEAAGVQMPPVLSSPAAQAPVQPAVTAATGATTAAAPTSFVRLIGPAPAGLRIGVASADAPAPAAVAAVVSMPVGMLPPTPTAAGAACAGAAYSTRIDHIIAAAARNVAATATPVPSAPPVAVTALVPPAATAVAAAPATAVAPASPALAALSSAPVVAEQVDSGSPTAGKAGRVTPTPPARLVTQGSPAMPPQAPAPAAVAPAGPMGNLTSVVTMSIPAPSAGAQASGQAGSNSNGGALHAPPSVSTLPAPALARPPSMLSMYPPLVPSKVGGVMAGLNKGNTAAASYVNGTGYSTTIDGVTGLDVAEGRKGGLTDKSGHGGMIAAILEEEPLALPIGRYGRTGAADESASPSPSPVSAYGRNGSPEPTPTQLEHSISPVAVPLRRGLGQAGNTTVTVAAGHLREMSRSPVAPSPARASSTIGGGKAGPVAFEPSDQAGLQQPTPVAMARKPAPSLGSPNGNGLVGFASPTVSSTARTGAFGTGPTGLSSRKLLGPDNDGSPPKVALSPQLAGASAHGERGYGQVAVSGSRGLAAVRARAIASAAKALAGAQEAGAAPVHGRSASVGPTDRAVTAVALNEAGAGSGLRRTASGAGAAFDRSSSVDRSQAHTQQPQAAASPRDATGAGASKTGRASSVTRSGSVTRTAAGQGSAPTPAVAQQPSAVVGRGRSGSAFGVTGNASSSGQGLGLGAMLTPGAAALLTAPAPMALGGTRAATGMTSPAITGGTSPRAAVPPASSAAPAAPARTSMWRVQQSSSTGLLYYYNRVTGVSQWSQPVDWDGEYGPGQAEALAKSHALAAQGTGNGGAAATARPQMQAVHPSHPPPQAVPALLGSPGTTAAAVGQASVAPARQPVPSLTNSGPITSSRALSALQALGSSEPPTAFTLPGDSLRVHLAGGLGKGLGLGQGMSVGVGVGQSIPMARTASFSGAWASPPAPARRT